MTKPWPYSAATQALPTIVLVILLWFTYAKFFLIPHAGFDWGQDGIITDLYVSPTTEPSLAQGDRLIQVGGIRWQDFAATSHLTLFGDAQPGQVIPITIDRSGQTLTIPWPFPGFNFNELSGRAISEWFLAYVFWLAGLLTILFLRPKDQRWWLLIAFNSLTAIWIAAGSSVTQNHLWANVVSLKVTIWLCLPVYWHLGWHYPQSLRRMPHWIWPSVYLAGVGLAVLEAAQFLPRRTYYLGFALAVAGNIAILILHFVLKREQRRDISLVLIAGLLALSPAIFIGLVGSMVVEPGGTGGALLALPLLPFMYLYAAYRKQLGGLELRANRAISLYAFLILLGSAWVVLVLPFLAQLTATSEIIFVAAGSALSIALITALGFGPFQAWVESRIFGIKLPRTELIESYSNRISQSLKFASLISLLKDEIAPSLFIRQSALVIFRNGDLTSVYLQGIDPDQLPAPTEIPALVTASGKQRPFSSEATTPCAWAKVILTLTLDQKPIGLWLLGRHDPDDFYNQREIATLQSLANQTAVALTNIQQSEQLHTLYQNDIEQRESERANVARELHDQVLNELGILWRTASERGVADQLETSIARLTTSLRQTITGLRPAAVDYGLYLALTDLVDRALNENPSPAIELALQHDNESPGPTSTVDLHLYRIVQQALTNSLRSAQASRITIQGTIKPTSIELQIEDDGVGFSLDDNHDIAKLVAQKHFGIAGMFERAQLIGATLSIDSAPGQGTRVHIRYRPHSDLSEQTV